MKRRTASLPGRPRNFDEREAVEAALTLFWKAGPGVGTRALSEVMGLGASSFSNTFASKQGLLLRALRRYDEGIRAEVLSTLTVADGRRALTTFFEALAKWLAGGEGGCLLLNLSMEPGLDRALRRQVSAYQRDLRAALADALHRSSPVLSAAKLEQRVGIVFLLVLGLSGAGRAEASAGTLHQLASAAGQLVDGWAHEP